MRIGLIIADFEMSYTTPFQHTARVKYCVDFTNSNVTNIKEKLIQLKENLHKGNCKNVHVGYDFSVKEVEHIQALLETMLARFTEHSPRKPLDRLKLYTMMQQLREAESPTAEQIAKDVVN